MPPYNGGLFDSGKYRFLEEHRMGDLYVARVLDLLSRSRDKAYIDYGSLEIRHLGSIYEGLLEYKLRLAEENLVPVKEKGKEVFVPLKVAEKLGKKINEKEIVQEGDLYLVTDKGERKATGSYYTPDYIVKYIIENTLGPLVERIKKEAELAKEIKNGLRSLNEIFEEIIKEKGEEEAENSRKLWQLTRNDDERKQFLLNMLDGVQPSHKYDPLSRILQLKVLDPAMGSGHFLVEATDFLARVLIEALGESPEEVGEDEIRWARREVVERCIFGVDLNPLAVELAKLSLWLYTVAKNRPLSFLDHHLRCGNSLIGAWIEDLKSLPPLSRRRTRRRQMEEAGQITTFEFALYQDVAKLLKAFSQIETLPSDTVEQIREKGELYQEFRKLVSRFNDIADVWTSVYFGNEISWDDYQELNDTIRGTDEEWKTLQKKLWFIKAKDIAREKRFFHWELEFPEIFFEGDHRKTNPGFDAVVGNPPYVRSDDLPDDHLNFLKLHFQDVVKPRSKCDLFFFFVNRGLILAKKEGYFSFIISNRIVANYATEKLRYFILFSNRLEKLADVSNFVDRMGNTIFPEANVFPVVIVVKSKSNPATFYLQKRCQSEEELWANSYLEIPTDLCSKFGTILINPSSPSDLRIFKRIGFLSDVIPLKKVAHVSEGLRGETISKEEYRKLPKDTLKNWLPEFRGTQITRYNLEDFNGYYKLSDLSSLQKDKGQSDASREAEQLLPKIVLPELSGRLEAALDREGWVAYGGVYYITRSLYDLRALLALLNSSFSTQYFFLVYRSSMWGEGFKFRTTYLEKLPIPRISFVTAEEERVRLLEEFENYYHDYLGAEGSENIFYFIKSLLAKEHKPDPELVKKHNADPLNKDWQIPEGALWEQSDVVHDILAFLAEQMIEMNKEKQKEIKGFLGWLESQLNIDPDKKGNTGIEALTSKTRLKNYLGDYQKGEEHLSLEDFWKILEKNSNRIGANLKSRELFNAIKTEYEKSLSKLLPLKERLNKTDWLIDQIVYKLYGLTKEEIEIVEQSFGI